MSLVIRNILYFLSTVIPLLQSLITLKNAAEPNPSSILYPKTKGEIVRTIIQKIFFFCACSVFEW